MVTACEKEAVHTPERATPVKLTDKELASNYLKNTPASLPFALLEMNHKTKDIKGIFIDKQTNIRKIEKENASYIRFDEAPFLAEYFMDAFIKDGEVIGKVDLEILADHVKTSRAAKIHDAFTVSEEAGETSQLVLAFNQNLDYEAHQGCGGNQANVMGETNQDRTFNIIILSATGKLNYEPTLLEEKALVSWLQSFEKLESN